MIVFVFETAHESAAKTADFCGIERKPLSFRHFYRHALEILEKLIAAARSAARTGSSQHFCFVPYAYLSEFYSRVENRRKVLYKLSEIHARLRRKIKYDFAAVESKLHIFQLHVKLALFYLFPCLDHALRLAFFVF